jgi:hypothetical protein
MNDALPWWATTTRDIRVVPHRCLASLSGLLLDQLHTWDCVLAAGHLGPHQAANHARFTLAGEARP